LSEFSIIERYCQGLGATHPETQLSVGDDAAVVQIPAEHELAISVDTLVAGVHFPIETSAVHIAHKLLAVNLSDMAAMGAQAKWATIGLTMPSHDTEWLASFSSTINNLATQYDVELIGGDTTQGPLCLTLQIMGLLPKGQKLTRAGAQTGDDIYLTHIVGDAALGLQTILDNTFAYDLDKTPLLAALNTPIPRTQLGEALLPIAHSCIDVSDGLLADLQHIAVGSGVDMSIRVEDIPLSKQYQRYIEQGGNYDFALTGGDDYELLFTAPASQRTAIAELSKQSDTQITCIGEVGQTVSDNHQPCIHTCLNQQPYQAKQSGFEHFSADGTSDD